MNDKETYELKSVIACLKGFKGLLNTNEKITLQKVIVIEFLENQIIVLEKIIPGEKSEKK